ncbi:Pex32p KNAG_0A03840 [Huiozyma naganishii CBS 8797]|uniref:TECPR1-like DysF domain-containing protein n=1 Tax=Huiozyma naganishii (strain ATCC MYA-139 / BCRC 22969 / CBS 8797 / KCTC 17520 / NBRC 10181 / NCYC 3082 / Yp74L-3) TaxID=1071383 RepID=J7S2B1_HUIN7|nr:hypothetical protein KNAG_0A03840 [Kazachstania naganishii CBS 8797]CCK68064.1 hypothetical protein KNAG_0A03840 [Kazachstania naganishii CBS 8797]
MAELEDSQVHAHFVDGHERKKSLVGITPLPLMSALAKMYPFLVVVDCLLDQVLWISSDNKLNFIYLVMEYLALRVLFTSSFIPFNLEAIIMYLIGITCSCFLPISFAYYIKSVYNELREGEPPTMDEIMDLCQNVVNKLKTIRAEMLNLIGGNGFSVRRLLTVCVILSPLQYALFKLRYLDARGFLLLTFLSASLFHSAAVQTTGILLWRLVWVRNLYHAAWNMDEECISLNQYIEYKSEHTSDKVHINLDEIRSDLPLETAKDFTFFLRSFLSNLGSENYNKSFVITKQEPLRKFHVLEITVIQNQRKWDLEGWLPRLMEYERPTFLLELAENNARKCSTLFGLESELPPNWFWLETTWRFEEWKYCNTQWVVLGENDTPECFTRTRNLKRLAFSETK